MTDVPTRPHAAATAGEVHRAFRWTFANSSVRLALNVGLIFADDVGCLAWQQDDNSVWLAKATGTGSSKWQQVGSALDIASLTQESASTPGEFVPLYTGVSNKKATLAEIMLGAGRVDGLAAAFTASAEFINTTAATSGVPVQASPAIALTGKYWDTTSGGTARSERWLIQARRGADAVSGELAIYGDEGKGAGSLQAIGLRRNALGTTLQLFGGTSGATVLLGGGGSLIGAIAGGGLGADATAQLTSDVVLLTSFAGTFLSGSKNGNATLQSVGAGSTAKIQGADNNHPTTAAGGVVVAGGVNSGAGPSGGISFRIGSNTAFFINYLNFLTSNNVHLSLNAEFGGDLYISSGVRSAAAAGRSIFVTSGGGGTGNQNGGNLVLIAGPASGSGTNGEVTIQTATFANAIRVSGTAAAIGFFGVAPATQPADQVAFTDSIGGTQSRTLAAIPDPADTPVTADALRDDIVANVLPKIRNALSSLADGYNDVRGNVLRPLGLTA